MLDHDETLDELDLDDDEDDIREILADRVQLDWVSQAGGQVIHHVIHTAKPTFWERQREADLMHELDAEHDCEPI